MSRGTAHGCGNPMMRVNVFEPVRFTQLRNDVLVGIAHDRENVFDAFSRNRGRERLEYLHGDGHLR